MFQKLLERNRSCRRFQQEVPLDRGCLEELVQLTRLAPSAANLQPLKFVVSYRAEDNQTIFACLRWAGYLTDWDGPAEGERPAGYIVILQDREIEKRPGVDHGIAAHTILLGAAEKGLGGCMIGSITRDELRNALGIPTRYDILLVVALGKPAEKFVLEDASTGDIEYWRDADGVHHVPKRPLQELLVEF